MIKAYGLHNNNLTQVALGDSLAIPANIYWIDLIQPTAEEEAAVEAFMCIDIPTREEMHEIELSNRLYRENNALYLTLTVVANADSEPESHAVTFVLTSNCLVTVRYVQLKTFDAFATRAERGQLDINHCSQLVFAGIVEAVINRLADVLEMLGHKADTLSQTIFRKRREDAKKPDLQQIVEQIGNNGDLVSKIRESTVSILRVVGFAGQSLAMENAEIKGHLKTLGNDVTALSDHAMFLASKLSFLLDATLGMINIEQNNIIKIFSVAAVVFLPPTLIASIYGMNFKHIPELEWVAGYPMAIVMMILSAIMPYLYFKHRNWL